MSMTRDQVRILIWHVLLVEQKGFLYNFITLVSILQRGCLPKAVREVVLGAEEAYLVKSEMYYNEYEDEVSALGEVHSNHTMSLSNPGLVKREPVS
jgi:hypothetical protein